MSKLDKLQQLREIKNPELKLARILNDRAISEALLKMKELQGVAGKDGYTPIKGVDYFTENEIEGFAAYVRSMVKDGKDGEKGEQGIPGVNGYSPMRGIDYWTVADQSMIVNDVLKKVPKPKDGISPNTDDIVKKALGELKKQPIHMKDIKGTEDLIAFLKLGGFRGGGGSGGGSGAAVWGSITGTLSDQTDLQLALDAKQATLVSGTNIKTINGVSLLGSGDITIDATVTLADLSANSTTTPTSLYTMTSGVNVDFKTSGGTSLLTLDETNDRVLVSNIRSLTSAGILLESNSGTDVALFGAGGGAGASFYGGVNIAGNLTVDTDTLFVDATNNRVGIGTTTPAYKLQLSSNFAADDGFAMTDTDGGYFRIVQSTGTAGAFQPIFQGYGTGNNSSMIFKGLQTTTGSPTATVIRFISRASDDSSVVNAATNAFTFENGATTVMAIKGLSVGIGDTSPSTNASRLSIAAGTLTSALPAISITATMPTSGAGTNGEVFTFTGAGSNSATYVARQTIFASGYTGAGSVLAGQFANFSAGTGTGAGGTSGLISYRPIGNQGLQNRAEGTTSGNQIGGTYLVGGGNINIASWAAATSPKNSATNVGIASFALNTGTSPVQVAGYFALADYGTSMPTFTSAALMADNGGTTSDIFVARDNGTAVFTIADGGVVTSVQDIKVTNVGTTSTSVLTTQGTQTVTNKRITDRVTTITSSATPTVNTDNCDAVTITALAAAITSMTTNLTGTPTNFQKLVYRIKDDGTARAITWGASFTPMGVALPTTTVANKILTVGFIYDTVLAKWSCVASVNEA